MKTLVERRLNLCHGKQVLASGQVFTLVNFNIPTSKYTWLTLKYLSDIYALCARHLVALPQTQQERNS
jgi:hypothetical protein